MTEISPAAADALVQLELEVLVRKVRPLCQLLIEIIDRSHFAEDPVDTFIKNVRGSDLDRKEIRVIIAKMLPQSNFTWFLTQVGLNQGMGLFSETFKRFEERFLPPLQHHSEVIWLIHQLFSASDMEKLVRLKPSQLYKLVQFFGQTNMDFGPFFLRHVQKSAEILAQRIAGLGLDTLVARKLLFRPDLSEHFVELGRWNFAVDTHKSADASIPTIKGCEEALQHIQSRREEEGTSLAITYRIFLMEDLLKRLKELISILSTTSSGDFTKLLTSVCIHITIQYDQRVKIRDFFTRNIEILAYQVTLLTGRTGEHYISNNSGELKKMWVKAIKGAFVVSIMVIIKILISKVPLAPLPQALAFGSLYAIGFVILHEIGGVLATKQPAMTASTLAAAMNDASTSESALKNLSDVVIRTLRTQMAALLGNYLFAFPFAVLFTFPLILMAHPFISFDKAHYILMDHHPVWSLSFMYAAIAGVCLFLSGLISGLADNWFDYNQIAIRLQMIFTSPRSKVYILKLKRSFGIWTGNIILGFMLGSMFSVGRVVGLPMDIRHVTFASGAFGISWIHQQDMLPWLDFFLIAGSVFMMGIINLAVSFSLSMMVAIRSRKLQSIPGRKLLWMVTKRILRNPLQLFMHR